MAANEEVDVAISFILRRVCALLSLTCTHIILLEKKLFKSNFYIKLLFRLSVIYVPIKILFCHCKLDIFSYVFLFLLLILITYLFCY